ncbi:PIG-L family deacetylase [Occultella glacieicola]|uniref:PIG-L family deacetylase n=1 Tax=Occultella glacieicola TaxID=2518684 RepID=A0ABY2E477_9MICO|nr:PIG-L family deacetylase [Occultella glacieicola]TDE92648.1 PIG-L family deacetylase [Occultella glacieicola]
MLDVRSLGTILGVWAHPDDEAFLTAGLMAAARDAGQRVVVVTATHGEHGTTDPAGWPPDRLGRIRALELAASLAALEVREHRHLGHPDGSLARQHQLQAIDELAAIVEDVQPDTIVTFGPDGLTGHEDHQTVSAWAGTARAASAPQARLLFATTTESFVRRWAHVHDRLNVFLADGLPLRTPDADVALTLDLSGADADRKLVALRAHASQTAGMLATIGADTLREWWSVETFLDADRTPLPQRRGADAGAAAVPGWGTWQLVG